MDQCLEQLENDYWGSPPVEATRLVKSVYDLRKVKIKDLSLEEIRLLISQNVGLEYLIPIAILYLKDSPLIEAYSYPGDLLSSVLHINKKYWGSHQETFSIILSILKNASKELNEIEDPDEVDDELRSLINAFESDSY